MHAKKAGGGVQAEAQEGAHAESWEQSVPFEAKQHAMRAGRSGLCYAVCNRQGFRAIAAWTNVGRLRGCVDAWMRGLDVPEWRWL